MSASSAKLLITIGSSRVDNSKRRQCHRRLRELFGGVVDERRNKSEKEPGQARSRDGK